MTSFTLNRLSKVITLSLIPTLGFTANVYADVADDAIEQAMEVITITNRGFEKPTIDESYAQGKTTTPDLAGWLNSVPGANVNRNGPVTGIAQFRGLYGDRVATTIDGQIIIGAGPNAMDTPLSYSTPLMVDSMTAFRGIAPVSAGINTLGGAIDVKMRKAEIDNQNTWHSSGDLQAGYRAGNNTKTLAGVANITQGSYGVMVYGNAQEGDNYEDGDGNEVSPTEFSKQQYGMDLRYNEGNFTSGLGYHYTDTTNSGTPALPMDIESIYSNRVSFDGNYATETWQYNWQIGYLDAEHEMTNFEMRQNNDPAKYRRNTATSDTLDFKFTMSQAFAAGELTIGLDGYQADHDSVITNPNNMMFNVVNFNNVKDDRFGLFIEWQQDFSGWNLHSGIRAKQAKADAGEVSTSMAMMMGNMGMMASSLRDDFNNADRSIEENNIDLAISMQKPIGKSLTAYIGLGIKNRAPSYQERYLWTPMEATGGLADGNTYIGDINIETETAYQSDLGLTYSQDSTMISGHVYYQNIDDYIQGIPLGMEDMTARMMAQMMAGDDNPLKFGNVDAKLYGADVNFAYQLSSSFSLSGIVSYVKGERKDIDDNLYRIAPLNAKINLIYGSENYIAQLNVTAVDAQGDVSMTNDEQKTSGYATVNLEGQYFVNADFSIKAGIDNLLDKRYTDHLGGYNRVKGSEINHMERLPGEGLSGWVEIGYSF
ncbi:TonB-dependent receptor [Thalassotalea sp. M1531]|uniref:TonB-dependent receptor n=1 Tax=Thalassotalea algicola TaxID=2716224 RepID=A0A7Y0LFE1_9GAMM|nr:TonB-dependent receptor [Thalassotalea algicola]NMP33232.1 TonB-dependent receptor [Thalassotalea algicola]